METAPPSSVAKRQARTNALLGGLTVVFAALVVAFVSDLWGRTPVRKEVPLVDPKFLDPAPWRQTYADLKKAKEDLSDFDCYGCHEKNKPPVIKFDENHKIVIPKEHEDLKMGHGSHDRNNLCYNCHNEQNLVTLQTRDGREINFDNAVPLCGSCHGPTLRDWEAGAHGRTGGYWDRSKGDIKRLQCANCHNPHAPPIPTREPAPAPHNLRDDPTPPQPHPAH